jgi:hypothetical protein
VQYKGDEIQTNDGNLRYQLSTAYIHRDACFRFLVIARERNEFEPVSILVGKTSRRTLTTVEFAHSVHVESRLWPRIRRVRSVGKSSRIVRFASPRHTKSSNHEKKTTPPRYAAVHVACSASCMTVHSYSVCVERGNARNRAHAAALDRPVAHRPCVHACAALFVRRPSISRSHVYSRSQRRSLRSLSGCDLLWPRAVGLIASWSMRLARRRCSLRSSHPPETPRLRRSYSAARASERMRPPSSRQHSREHHR